MSLSKDLISQFVKATKDTTTVKKESTVYGTVVKYNEKTYVKIDGSDLLTPAETLSSVEEGERVSIMIKDHTATITGNYTAPSASSIKVDGMDADLKANTADIKNLVAKNAEIENLVASKANIEDLRAANAEIDTLKADYAEIETLVADKASIGDLAAVNADIKSLKADKADIAHLEANYATIGSLNAVYADVTRLEADKANIKDLEANYATIESLEANYATIKQLDAANANITNLQAETANINTALIDKANVSDLAAANALIADLKAGKADVGDLTAANAKIANLEAGKADISVLEANYATIKQLDAANANITNLQTETANINTALIDKANVSDLAAANAVIDDLKAGKADIADLTAANAKIANLEAGKADISVLEANYATIKQLNATNANVTNLQTETANINKALIDKADVSDLNATNANVTNLQATKANVSDLNATNANVNTLTGNLADITTLVNGNLTSDNIQSMVITGDKFTVEDGFIKNAMIDSVNANKINTGVINTNNVKIQSNDGSMILQGNLQQFKDKNGKVRIQIGKDATGNFTFVLYDENGTGQLINQNGIQSSNAIADGLIVDSKVADNANIAGSKLDIDSVVTEVNNGTTSIKGTKIYLDDQKQALNVAFNNMSTTVKGNTNTIQSHTTSINTMNGKVTQLISDTTITKQDGTTTSLKDAYNATVDTVDSHSTKIGSLETNLATANNNISSVSSKQATLEQNLNGFKQTVSKTYATQTSVTDVSNNLKNNYSTTSAMNSAINQKANEITSSVSETYATKTSLKATDDKFANYSTTSQMNSAINQKSDSILSTVSNTYTTKADFNGLRVGGTNLVKNSKLFSSVISNDGWQILNTGSEGYKKLFIETTDPNWKEIYIPLYSAINSLKNKITISFDYTETKSGLLGVSFGVFTASGRVKELENTQASTLKVIGNPDGWKRVSYTIDPTSLLNQANATQYGLQFKKFIDLTGSIQIKKVQVEIGTITTEWSPAPQDIDTAISTVDGKFTNYSTTSQMNSAINQKANEITSTVSETYATKASLTTVDNKFANYSTTSAMNSAINQKANEITSSVSETYATKTSVTDVSNNLKNNYSTTSAMNTAINQKADSILSTVSKTYATQTSVTDVSNNLKNNYSTTSAMNSAINQKANEITSSVSETYATKTSLKATDDKFANYSTTSQMNSAINQKSDSILSTVSNTYTTKADFNGLSIGGRNFLVGTKNAFTKAINTTNHTEDYTTNDPYTTYNSQTLSSLGLKVGDKITVSFDWSLSNVTTAGNFRVETVQDGAYKSLISGPHNFGSDRSGRYIGTKTLTSSDVSINKIRIRVDASNLTMTIKNMKLEKGDKATSWTPAPEDIDSAISTVDSKFTNYSTTSQMNSAINQKANEITSTVSETYATKASLTTVDNKFANYSTTSAMNTAINQKADSILSTVSKTYATQTSVTDVSNNLKNNYSTTSAMNTAINQKSDAILSTVSKTYATQTALNTVDNKFANYSTTLQMNSAINQKSDSILSTVSNTYTTKADFNNLSIGGTNLIANSAPKSTSGWQQYAGGSGAWTLSLVDCSSSTYGKAIRATSNNAAIGGIHKQPVDYTKLVKNEYYTLSAWIRASKNCRVNFINEYMSNNNIIDLTTEWKYYSHTDKLTGNGSHSNIIYLSQGVENGMWIEVHSLKLEKGTKSSSWSPAPQDIDDSITTVDNKFTNYSTTSQMNSAINQKANEITSAVSNTYATKTALNTVDGKFANYSTTSAMNTAINQKSDAILSTVSSTYATKTSLKATDDKFANYSTTSQMNSAINQKGDSILSTVSSTYATKTALNTVDGKFANYSTTSAMNSAINQKGDSILSTVSNTYTTKADFNDLTIGGRNFLVGTKNAFTKALNTSNSANDFLTNDPYTTYNSQKLSSLGFKVGDKITVSFDWSLSNVTTAGNFRVETVEDATFKTGISGPHNFGSNTSGRYVGTKTLTSTDININKIRIRVDASNLTITIKNMKLEKGNKDTSWSPAPEDIDSAISTVDNKFANYSTTSQMNSAINQKANEITSSVSQTYATKTSLKATDDKFANYSTTSAMNTAINQKANEITSSVSNTYTTKTEFGNLRVGGTNLVKNSKLFGSVISNPGGWQILNTGSEGYKKLFIETTDTNWKEIYIPLYSAINSLKNKITISFDYTETKSGLLGVSFGVFTASGRVKELDNTQASTLKVIGNPDGWKRVSYTIDPTSLSNQANATQYGIQFKKWSTLTGSIQIKKVQAEIGTIATEWNPAPQDTEGSISSLTTRMSNAESKLTKDSLTTTIGSYYTTSNDVNGLITSKGYATTSQVSQTATDLTAKFSSSGGYNLLRNSIFTRNGEYWTIDSTYTTIDTSRTFNGHNSLKINSTGATSDVWRGPKQRFAENIPSGKTYTASLWYYVANKSTFNSEFRLELKGKKTGASGESGIADTMIAASNLVQGAWTKVTVTATTRESWEYLFIYPWVKRNGTIWITELQVEEGPLATLWSPHPSEIYDGITQINKDGIKVYHSNINGENYTHMASSGFYIKNKGVDIFKVDTNGLYVKGKITSTSGDIGGYTINEHALVGTNVGMSSLSGGYGHAFWAGANGAANSGSAPFRVGHDGKLWATNAEIKGKVEITSGSMPSSLLTGTIDNARLNSTIVNGANNGSSAKSTLDSKANGWDSAKSTVDNNKTNWSNAYNRVVQWASGSVTGNTTINGGLIQTGTVTAKQLYLGDLTNYCNLREETASLYGFTSESSSWGTWYKVNNNQRDICISGNKVNDYGYYKCLGGESFRIKFEVKSNVKASSTNGGSDSVYCGVNIGLYGKLGDGNNFYQIPSSGYVGDANSTEGHINVWTTLPANARSFGVFLQLSGWNNWSGTCRIKNVQVFRMSSGELIVDGSITANKINVSDLSALNATIGGFSMYNGKLVGTGGNGVGMSGNGTDWAFWAGSNTGGNAPFHVGHEGNLYATQAYITGTITGSTINAGTINGATINSDSFVGDVLAIDGAISAKSLQVQDIDSAKYPATLDGNVDLYVNSSSGNDDNEPDDGVRYKTIQGAIDAIPKFLNNKTVYITMETNSTEDVSMRGIVGGAIRIYMNGKTLYGTLRSYVCAASINVYGGTRSSTEGATGVIHPSVGISFGGRATSVGFEASQYAAIYKVKVFAPDSLPSDVTNTDKVCIASQSGTGSVYCKNIQIVNAAIGFRANNLGAMHINSSSGVASKYGFQATTGGIITIANNAQAGGKTSSTNKSAGGQVLYDTNGPTFATGNQSTDGGTAPVAPTTKVLTVKSSYGDTYRSSVYKNWKKDGTVRQGDYGYGDCNGCWFFGSAFSEVKGATIKKVTITITRQSGGSSSAVGLVVKSHGHSSRPSGAPTFRTTAGTLSLAPGKSGPLVITNSTILNEIKSGVVKGFGIQTTYDSSHYAVCSGSVTVKIEYQE